MQIWPILGYVHSGYDHRVVQRTAGGSNAAQMPAQDLPSPDRLATLGTFLALLRMV